MSLTPLDQVRLNASSHVSALRWIGLLYRQPVKVEEIGHSLIKQQRAKIALKLYFHALPYVLLIAGVGRSLPLLQGKALTFPDWVDGGFFLFPLAICTVAGITFAPALAFGLAAAFALALINLAVYGAFAIGLPSNICASVGNSIPIGLAIGIWLRLFTVRFGAALSIVAVICVFGAIVSSTADLAAGVAAGLALGASAFRIYYLPIHFLFILARPGGRLYNFHPAAWDNGCILPFPGLDRLLIDYSQFDSEAAEREIDRLIDEYPAQRRAALCARAIIVARHAAATTSLVRLDETLTRLPQGRSGFLKETPELRRRVHDITALQARLDTLDRAFLREPFAALLVKEIESFEQQIAGYTPPLSTELRKAARRWLEIALRQLDAARATTTREPTHQVFRAGDPVDREREAFVLRAAILSELEQQAVLATGCPGLLVYGRRRMGKSTLLRNLEGLLPPQLRVASLSMQEARAFSSLADLISLIGRRVAAVLQGGEEPLADLRGLERFLDATQERLDAADARLLFAIDEFEYLDHKIGEGVLSKDLLAVIRESIQAHRRIIWTFAGSHAIDELVHAPWSSYLVSARTVEVTLFEPAETRLLLTEPLKHSSLWRAADAEAPRFEPGFWGDGGIERIHAETGGWPHLVQLVAETVVDHVNDAGGASVDDALFERALDRAVVRGNNVFLELVEKESRLPGEWDYLHAFRRTEEQPAPEDEAVARSLRRRRLVVEEDGRYRLRVPLMARWLRQRV